MEWHYERNGSAVGPVSEAQIHAARAGGEITGTTRVWQVGWPDWKPASEVWSPDSVPQPGSASCCSECGRFYPSSELVRYDNVEVCASCKPILVDKLRQGVTLGAGPWQDGKKMVVLKGSPLPDLCFKCGAPPVKTLKKTLTWHHPLIYIAILPGLLVYVLIALCVRKTAKVGIPLCRDCNRSRNRKILFVWLGMLTGMGVLISSFYFGETDPSLMGILATSGALITLGSLFWVALAQTVVPKKIDKTHAWLAKSAHSVLERLPQWRG